MLSRYINFPLGLAAAILGAMAFYTDNGYLAIAAMIFVIAMVGVYFFSDSIDWWWSQSKPPQMDDRMVMLLEQRLPFYAKLSEDDKQKFQSRVELYIQANEFIPNGWEKIPYDIQAWVAVNPIMLTFHKEYFLLNQFERVVIYPHSFPSPQYPERFHCSEVYEEDGVLLFSNEKLLPGVMRPQAYFNIGLYEYAKVFRIMNPEYDYPVMSNIDWLAYEGIVRYTKAKLEEYIGLTDLDEWAILAVLFFSHPEKMKQQLEHHFTKVAEILSWPV